ncbi:MAG TPA: endonuclease III [Thermodesulfobacteriota bacterium]|nr:endonuclease III [Thermodesulfobacteriota bacterium]
MRPSEGQWKAHKSLRATLSKIILLLETHYGIPRRTSPRNPLNILIETILSQNTNDQTRDRAYQGLKKRFPRWEDALEANTREIASAIRQGGLAKQKAKRIRAILLWIKNQEGKLSLSFLRKIDSEEIKTTIGALKGVGPKTIHCLLLFGLGREAFPVDTHILRIGKRLGFIPEGMDAEEAHVWMNSVIPKKKSLSLHLNLIRFGRSLCKARNPSCDVCFLSKKCLYFVHRVSILHLREGEVKR